MRDYEEEVATSVEISKKNHHPRYIAPMSMNKYANLAKQQRVMAPNVSRMIPFKEGCMRNGHFADSNVSKKIRLQHLEKGHRDGQLLDKNATKNIQSREKITIREMILNKKGHFGQKEVFNQNLEQPHSMTTKVSNGPKRRLFLVDTDDDEDDNVSCRGEDDENENIDPMICENIQNQIEKDNSDDGLDYQNDELDQEQRDAPQSEKTTATSSTKKRGPTMMHEPHVRNLKAREIIICNEFGQPIGPVTEEKDTVGQFSRFLGTIARNSNHAPLIYNSWHKVPHKDKMWEYVQGKYIVPDNANAKSWVLKSIGACWRGYKCRLKKAFL